MSKFKVNDNLEPIKISVTGYNYYVNEAKKTVGCRMFFDIKGPDCVIKILEQFADTACCEVHAEAHLDPADKFDYKTGVRIARAKAESMAYRRANNLFKRICGKLADAAIAFANFDEKTAQVLDHNKEYIAKF